MRCEVCKQVRAAPTRVRPCEGAATCATLGPGAVERRFVGAGTEVRTVHEEEPGDAYWRVVETVWEVIDIDNGGQRFLETYAAAGPVAAMLFAVHFCQSEVRNGGFGQFFSNSTGLLAPEAARGFRLLGMLDATEILEKAMTHFGLAYPRERSAREALLGLDIEDDHASSDRFETLDDASGSLGRVEGRRSRSRGSCRRRPCRSCRA